MKGVHQWSRPHVRGAIESFRHWFPRPALDPASPDSSVRGFRQALLDIVGASKYGRSLSLRLGGGSFKVELGPGAFKVELRSLDSGLPLLLLLLEAQGKIVQP